MVNKQNENMFYERETDWALIPQSFFGFDQGDQIGQIFLFYDISTNRNTLNKATLFTNKVKF
jgi:hypothetical protein